MQANNMHTEKTKEDLITNWPRGVKGFLGIRAEILRDGMIPYTGCGIQTKSI